ncbi:MAG: hypothetical protein PHO66_03095 [Eubacteriales bacterium]|nr:hypothetical protein [Eubacteriales bacterium]
MEAIELVSMPVDDTTYQLHDEVRIGGFVCVYVDAQTGEGLQ